MPESFLEKIRRLTEPEYFKFFLIPRARLRQRKCVRKIRKTGHVRVIFLVSSLPMWKFQPLFDRLHTDSRFEVAIAIFPFPTFSETQKQSEIEAISDYCKKHGIRHIDLSSHTAPGKVLRATFNPDLLFYPQPYNHLFGNDLDHQFFSDKLICYIPYAIFTSRESWAYKTLLNNTAWRLFYPSEARKQEAIQALYNQGRNIRITGEILSDLFRGGNRNNSVWKPQKNTKKRIIWAPHFSVQDGGPLHRDSFIWLNAVMLDLASRYKDRIQFCFKPHPRLFSALCEMPEWGEERTRTYYKRWIDGENTQLNTGSYIDLFMESDAMIHDSSSFTAEYLFTGKPVLFTSQKISAVLAPLNEVGRDAIMAHYICNTELGIIDFIERTILGNQDTMQVDRELFYQKYLCPPEGHPASESIYTELLSGLGLR